MNSIIQKLHFEVELYDKQFHNDTINEVEEYKRFLDNNLKILDKIVDLVPENICAHIVQMCHNSGKIYLELVHSPSEPSVLPVGSYSSLHIFTVNTHILFGLHSHIPLGLAEFYLPIYIEFAIAANKHAIERTDQITQISLSLTLVHCELLQGLRTWLPDMKLEKDKMVELLSSSYPLITDANNSNLNYKLLKAAANLISYLIGLYNESQYLKPLFSAAVTFSHLPQEVQLTMKSAIFNWVLNNSDELEEHRISALSSIFSSVFPDNEKHIKSAITLIKYSQPKNNSCKKMLAKVLLPGLKHIVNQFPSIFSTNRDKCILMMEFFSACFYILQDYIVEFLREALPVFVYCFSGCCSQSNLKGAEVLFQILMTAVEFPSSAFTALIPSSITLCLEYLQVICPKENFELHLSIFKLLSAVLIHKWKVISNINYLEPNISLNVIMKAYLDSFDIASFDVISSNIRSLELVNERWKLYHKDFFKIKFLADFQTAFLTMLIKTPHHILTETIIIALFSMACVDFTNFYDDFMVTFIMQLLNFDTGICTTLHNNLKRDMDLPSFEVNVLMFVNDVRYYKRQYSYISSSTQYSDSAQISTI